MPSGTSIVLKEGTKGIAGEAFRGCSGLTSVTWNVKNCNNNAYYSLFIGCTNIKTFEFASEVERIPAYLCDGLTDLTSVTIPNSVTEIGNSAFRDCTGLTRIEAYPNPEKVSTGGNVFYSVPKNETLHVLPKYMSAYRTASQWRDFTNIKGDLTENGGDINLDGKVNVTDVTTLVNMIANGETANLELVDINADGKVNVSDVTALVNIILK